MLLLSASATVNIHVLIFSNTAWTIETKLGWSQDGPLQSLMFLFRQDIKEAPMCVVGIMTDVLLPQSCFCD